MAARISGYLPTLLQMIAPRMGVNMVFGDISTGSANKDTVTITNSVLQMRDREKAEKLALGLLCHEGIGHILQTDFKAWDVFCKKHPEGVSLLNVIEDCRIERRSWIKYPGVKSMLADVCEVLGEDKLKLPTGQVDPGNALVMGLLHVLRGEFLDQSTDIKGGRKLLEDTFGKQVSGEVIALALIGANAESTQDATVSVLDILKKLNIQSQPPQQQPGPGAPQSGQGQSQPGQGSPQPGQGTPQSGQGQPQPGQGTPQPGHGSPTPEQGQNAAAALQQMANGQVQETDLGNIIQGVAEAAPQQSGGSGSTPIYGKVKTEKPSGIPRIPGTEALAAARRMSARLEQLMSARVDDDDRLSHTGELSGNQLARVRLLDSQVFIEEGDEMEGIDSAVLFLADASGSMSDKVEGVITRAELCFNAAWAASSAMAKYQAHGVEMAIWGYGSHLTKFIGFGAWSFQKDRFKLYSHGGGTATFPACVEAIGELAKQKQKRKHLILLSDGDLGGDATEKHLKEAMKAGIEVSVIFIGDKNVKPEAVSKVLKDRVYIVHNVDSMVQAMFACLKPR